MSKAEEPTDAPIDILILEGDGIGPEITAATLTVLEAAAGAARLSFRFGHAEIGFKALRNSGSTMPDQVLAQARAATGIILGPVSHNEYPPIAEGGLNPSGLLRRTNVGCPNASFHVMAGRYAGREVHKRGSRARKALTRIANFFAELRKTAEQLTPLERWNRILPSKISARANTGPVTPDPARRSRQLRLRTALANRFKAANSRI
jgi:hypothetical protein